MKKMTSKQLQIAYNKGYFAYNGTLNKLEICPYKDKKTNNGKVTFSRAFRTAWFEGWNDAIKD